MANPIVEYILRMKDEAAAGLDAHGKKTKETGEEVEKTTEKTKAGSAAFAKYGAAALAGVTAFIALNQKIADTRNQITDMSTRTGIGADTLNGLKLAAEGSGLSLDSLERTLARFPQVMGEAESGTGAAADAFERLDVSVTDSTGTLRDADTVFREAVEAIGRIEDPTNRAAAAADLFGTSGTKLLQALGDPAALEAFIDQADRFGTDVGPAAAKAAGDWQRSMADLKLVLTGTVEQISGAMGGVTAFVDDFALGIVFVSNLTASFIENTIQGFTIVTTMGGALIDFLQTGDKAAFIGTADQLQGGKDFTEMVKEATEAAEAFFKNRERIRAGSSSGGLPGGGTGSGGGTGGGTGGGDELIDIEFLSLAEVALMEFEETYGQVGDTALEVADKAGRFDEQIAALADEMGRGLTAADELTLAAIDLDLAFSKGLITLEDYEQAISDIATKSQSMKVNDFLGSAGFQAGSSLLTGDAMGAVGSALPMVTGEPVSTAIMTSLQLLTTIGQQGSDAIIAQLKGFSDTLIAGVEALPELIPGIVVALTEMIPDLVAGIVTALPDILIALIQASRELALYVLTELPFVLLESIGKGIADWWDRSKPSWWGTPLRELPALIWQGIKEWWSEVKDTIAGWFSIGGNPDESFFADGNSSLGRTLLAIGTLGISEGVGAAGKGLGFFADGGYVPRTQLAVVHQGERVVARNGAISGGARRNLGLGQTPGINVNISAAVVDNDAIPRLVREVERVFGDYGRASSMLFG